MSEGEGSTSDYEGSNRIKIVVAGDAGCGKTSLNVTFAKKVFPEDLSLINWEEYETSVQLEGRLVPVELFEIPSYDPQTKFRVSEYGGTDVALLCFSIDNSDSFDNVSKRWLPELRTFVPDVPVVLVGTKCDLRYDEDIVSQLAAKSKELVSSLEALALCEKIRAYEYVECSAKTGEGLYDAYRAAVEAVAEM